MGEKEVGPYKWERKRETGRQGQGQREGERMREYVCV